MHLCGHWSKTSDCSVATELAAHKALEQLSSLRPQAIQLHFNISRRMQVCVG